MPEWVTWMGLVALFLLPIVVAIGYCVIRTVELSKGGEDD